MTVCETWWMASVSMAATLPPVGAGGWASDAARGVVILATLLTLIGIVIERDPGPPRFAVNLPDPPPPRWGSGATGPPASPFDGRVHLPASVVADFRRREAEQ